eukprot:gene6372-7636_t
MVRSPFFMRHMLRNSRVSSFAVDFIRVLYEKDYPVYVEVKTSTEMKKVAKGVTKKKKQVSDPKIMFRLRKHTMAGVVQDPAVLTSRAVIRAGTYEEVAKDLHANLMEGVGIAAVITDESKKQDLGKADGEAIVFAMGDITVTNSINHEASENRLKTLTNFLCGNVLGPLSITEYQFLELVLEKNVKEFGGAKKNWTPKRTSGMVFAGKIPHTLIKGGRHDGCIHSLKWIQQYLRRW